MRTVEHITDNTLDSKLISELTYDNNTLIFNELTNEMFRFVKPSDTNQAFSAWKTNMPKYTYQAFGGTVTTDRTICGLSAAHDLYNRTELFASDFTNQFMVQTYVYWQKRIGGTGNDVGDAIALDSSGNIFLNGYQNTETLGGNDLGVIKLNNSGVIQWQKRIGGAAADVGKTVDVDSSGNVYFGGYQASDTYGANDGVILKFNNDGYVQWQKKIGGGTDDYPCEDLVVDSTGNVYLCGYQSSDATSNAASVIKLDTDGVVQWQKKLDGANDDQGWHIDLDSSNNIYVCGRQNTDTAGGYDCLVFKLDSSGALQWQKKIGGLTTDEIYGLNVDASSNVYVCGRQDSDSYGNLDICAVKLDTNGNLLWQKKIGGADDDRGRNSTLDSSGNFYITGLQKSDSYGDFDYFVIKLNPSGDLVWQKKIGGNTTDYGLAIVADDSGNLYLNGCESSDSFGQMDYGVMKINTTQSSDMNLSIADMALTIGNSTLTYGDMSLSIDTSTLNITNSSYSIADVDMAGEIDDLICS